jgi:adenylyltransferase/sulfurtransferase
LIRWWDQERLRAAKTLVLGAGALGNEVVKNLALLGVGNVTIIDFDRIETSNLTRSALFRPGDEGRGKAEVLASRAREINPEATFTPLGIDVRYDLGLNLLRGMDLVFGCLDNRESRYYLNRACYLLQKTFIDGGLDTLNGAVSVFQPPETACYECTLNQIDRAELAKRISCLKSTEPEMKSHIPTAPTVASIVAGLQTQIGVRMLHGLQIPAGKRIGLYGLTDVFFDIKLEISKDCGMHAAADPIPAQIESMQVSEFDALQKVLEQARFLWNATQLTWDFDRNLITFVNCTSCGVNRPFIGTEGLFSGSSACACGGMYKGAVNNSYTGLEPWGTRSFRDLGFPTNHVYCAVTPDRRIFFTLITH